LIKGSIPTAATTTTTKQNVNPAVYFVYSRVKTDRQKAAIEKPTYGFIGF
jgi:hypothetical protein